MTLDQFHNFLVENGFAQWGKGCDGLVGKITNEKGVYIGDFLTSEGWTKEEYSEISRGHKRNWITYRKYDVCTVTHRKPEDIANHRTGRKVKLKSFSLSDPVNFIGRNKNK